MIIKFLEAHKGDSILISHQDDEGTSRNILIDGGMSSTYFNSSYNQYGQLHLEIEKIKKRKEKIDLLILSHIDNDHIEGLLKWFSTDAKAYNLVGQVWFNSGKSIAQFFKKEENNDLRLNLKVPNTTYTGVAEAIEFEDYLLKHKIWDKKIIRQGDEFALFGVQLKILSPDNSQLKKLVGEYNKKTGDPVYTSGKKEDWAKNLKDIIQKETLDSFRFKQDTSVKNGSSITVLLTYAEKNFLFLADSHPDRVLKSLQELGYSKEKPIPVELFQISHHGSKSNMHKELLEVVKTNKYVISTDSSSHGHPHKATLARIISVNPQAVIYFNYENVKKSIFTEQDLNDFPNFETKLISEYPVSK
ncbi:MULTISPECIES: ComEC/Rec2 family competence protein [Maribacter]|jgi:beta-lactamase superfamily II metal-dependent hydrolase|uniref:MBL fold metallo-hydrolase n=2 Tax=Maribacter cobaltidurans TaxID=1178778 RepID=A0ABU7IU60_9FLAO|nr:MULTISPECIES: MBL fold metallo-hydrolase [Maribacter]ASV32331.1 hypothetical protein CJ263_20040 [Maribacter cobaltidurans]MDC6388677.1 MBL fold metallo-hydrolase [Maribacter sp. PR1]MEE1976066.1 MBL fold metallo-hydrolase [Maribacter cobaltidurans]GGD94611.1 hypothetical protein GCM10011412_35790 [Maribacter cobaltidurans]